MHKALSLIPVEWGVGCPKGKKEIKRKKREGISPVEKSKRLGMVLGILLSSQHWTMKTK